MNRDRTSNALVSRRANLTPAAPSALEVPGQAPGVCCVLMKARLHRDLRGLSDWYRGQGASTVERVVDGSHANGEEKSPEGLNPIPKRAPNGAGRGGRAPGAARRIVAVGSDRHAGSGRRRSTVVASRAFSRRSNADIYGLDRSNVDRLLLPDLARQIGGCWAAAPASRIACSAASSRCPTYSIARSESPTRASRTCERMLPRLTIK